MNQTSPSMRLRRAPAAEPPPRAAIKLAYLVTHPVQYQAPLLRRIAALPGVDLEVFFQSDVSVRAFRDQGFGETITWDVPLLEGYTSTVLPIVVGSPDRIGLWTPINRTMISHLRRGAFDALWVHGYARPYNIAVAFLARLMGLTVLIRDEAHRRGTRRRRHVEFLKRCFIQLCSRCGMRFLAIGQLNGEYYRALGIPSEQIFTMPYAVDNAYFQRRAAEARKIREAFRASLGLVPGAPVILFAGKFQPRKRAGDLLEAYRRLLARLETSAHQSPAPYLLFAGAGETLEKTRAAAEGLPGVRFLGFQSQAELARLYDLCDVFVMPSAHEPWGLVVNEVMNAGAAVIVTDEAGCGPDLVKSGENGFIYPVGDVERLTDHLLTLMRDPGLRAAMGRRSLDIIKGWSFEEDCEGLLAALESAAAEKGG